MLGRSRRPTVRKDRAVRRRASRILGDAAGSHGSQRVHVARHGRRARLPPRCRRARPRTAGDRSLRSARLGHEHCRGCDGDRCGDGSKRGAPPQRWSWENRPHERVQLRAVKRPRSSAGPAKRACKLGCDRRPGRPSHRMLHAPRSRDEEWVLVSDVPRGRRATCAGLWARRRCDLRAVPVHAGVLPGVGGGQHLCRDEQRSGEALGRVRPSLEVVRRRVTLWLRTAPLARSCRSVDDVSLLVFHQLTPIPRVRYHAMISTVVNCVQMI